MGLHKLEIEVTDELLSRIDSVSERTRNSRADVIVETLTDHLPETQRASNARASQTRRERIRALLQNASRHSSGLSGDEVLREIKDFRGDE
jgi:metal-responsive CopG/Arc/MetJ family transcriptional regulator